MTDNQIRAAQWVIVNLNWYMKQHCRPDDPEWQNLELAKHELLGVPIPET